MTNPLKDIEDKKAQLDVGVLAARIFQGARDDGLTRWDAMHVVVGFFVGLSRVSPDEQASE